jgi:putative membrane protein
MGHDEVSGAPIVRRLAGRPSTDLSRNDRVDEASVADSDVYGTDLDYRFSLANERTYLAWIRTALASVAGGIAAAKTIHFHHESVRWLISAPPIIAGSFLSLEAASRWRRYERAMRAQMPLPAGHWMKLLAISLATYALVALLAITLDH